MAPGRGKTFLSPEASFSGLLFNHSLIQNFFSQKGLISQKCENIWGELFLDLCKGHKWDSECNLHMDYMLDKNTE